MAHILIKILHWIGRKIILKNIREVDSHIFYMEEEPKPEDIQVMCHLIYFLTTSSNYPRVNTILNNAKEELALDPDNHLILLNALKNIRRLS